MALIYGSNRENFFVSRYRVKFRDDTVILSWNFAVRSLAVLHSVRRQSRSGN